MTDIVLCCVSRLVCMTDSSDSEADATELAYDLNVSHMSFFKKLRKNACSL